MSPSSLSHPFLGGLLDDEETAQFLTAQADISAMLLFERSLANAQAAAGLIPVTSAETIARVCENFQPDMAALLAATRRDGVVVPELVRQLRAALGGEVASHVHFGATSQDVVDTSLMLRLKRILDLFLSRLQALDEVFEQLGKHVGDTPLMAHTRMQAALPIRAKDRIRAWRMPLSRHAERMRLIGDRGLAIQLGGAAGTLDKLGDKGLVIRLAVATELGLSDEPQWQSQRDRIVDVGDLLSLVTGSLGKFGQDVALAAQSGFEIRLSGGGGSSAMPHKQNPVAAEVLVSLARFNAVQVSGLHQALVHEQERSGSAWTLEWMILPQMLRATGAALRLATELGGNIRSLGSA